MDGDSFRSEFPKRKQEALAALRCESVSETGDEMLADGYRFHFEIVPSIAVS